MIVVEHGVDRAVVALLQHVHEAVGKLRASLVLIPAREDLGRRVETERAAKLRGRHRVAQRVGRVKLADEEIASRNGFLHHVGEPARAAGHESHALALVSRLGGRRGIVFRRRRTVADFVARVARGPKRLLRDLSVLILPRFGPNIKSLVQVAVLKVEVMGAAKFDHLLDTDEVGTRPLAVLRCDRVFHGALGEVVYAAAGRRDRGARTDAEVGSQAREVRLPAHGKFYRRLIRLHVAQRVGIEEKPTAQVLARAQVGLLDVAFRVERLVLEAGAQAERQGQGQKDRQVSIFTHFTELFHKIRG